MSRDVAPPPPHLQGYTTIDQLCCSHGHPLRDAFLGISERPFRCTFRERPGARECGEIVWVLFNGDPRLVYVAVITVEQLRHMKTLGTAYAILRWLGAPIYPARPKTRAA